MLINQFKGGDVKVISDGFAAVFKSTDAAQDDRAIQGVKIFLSAVQKRYVSLVCAALMVEMGDGTRESL
jgi:hypothetical protein